MKLTLVLLLCSLSFLLVSALDESNNQDVEIQSRLVREAGDRKREKSMKKKKYRKRRKQQRKAKKQSKGKKGKGRQKKKQSARRNNKSDRTGKKQLKKVKNERSKPRRRNNKKSPKKASRTPVPPSPVAPAPPMPPTPDTCPPVAPCPGSCDKVVMEKAMGFKKAQNWYRQCKRISSQTKFIISKKGKSGDFMAGAMALDKVTMNGTKCADEMALPNATAAMNTLNGCKASVEMDCMCPSTRQDTNSTGGPAPATTAAGGAPSPPGPATTPAPGSPASMAPEPPMGMCMECEEANVMKLKEIIDAYNDCIEKSRGITRQDSDLCKCLEAVETPDPMLNPGELVKKTKDQATKCKAAFGECSKTLKTTGPLVGSCCMTEMTTAKARQRNFLKKSWI